MKHIAFNTRFVNAAGDDLVPGKIHTIRRNYDYWKKFEGRDLALFTWEGKAYRRRHKVFCVKRLVSVQDAYMQKYYNDCVIEFLFERPFGTHEIFDAKDLWKHDGFRNPESFEDWFVKYPDGEMAVLHFTEYRY